MPGELPLAKPRVAAIVGPTAVGKSAVAVDVAELLDAEIVSTDSMQMYRGMDVGTDKATQQMRERVVHHLLDIRTPAHPFSVAEFQAHARAAVEDITRRQRLPLLVGGSGLYFRAVVDDLQFLPRSVEVRRALEDQAAESGPAAMHERLARVDSVAAQRIDARNARRVVRALEIIELTGRELPDQDEWTRFESVYDLRAAGLALPRKVLWHRIDQRVDKMLDAGLAREARRLASEGMGETARQALGYRQVLDAPDGSTREDLAVTIARATKRFARRQESWFRADPRIAWFDAAKEGLADRISEYLAGRAAVTPGPNGSRGGVA